MALQTSGAISLDDIHVEAGGTTGTSVSINDSDVRGLISASASSEMALTDWYGASNITTLADLVSQTTITVTQGDTDDRFSTSRYFGFYGAASPNEGSVSPTSLTFGTPNTSLNIRYATRRANVSGGVTDDSSSAFWLSVKHPSDNTIRAGETSITGVTINVDGGTLTLSESDATFTSTTAGSTWVWFASDFTSQEHTDFITEWDGSGNTTVVVNT